MEYKRYVLSITLFLMFFSAGFWEDGSHADNFSDYINSPVSSSGNMVNKGVNSTHATNYGARKNSDKTDTKPALQGIPAKWKTCVLDSDCTAGVADCVSWEPLNKNYLHKLSKNLDSCSASIDPGFQPETVCVDKACKITEKATHVSWEEWLGSVTK